MKKVLLIQVEQPIGTFYLGQMKSEDIIEISKAISRKNFGGIQRMKSENRVKEIALYCEDPDATFPTPIILSIDTKSYLNNTNENIFEYEYDEKLTEAEIIDGQHRIEGIKKSKKSINLPVVIIFNITAEEKAYIFSTINGNQDKVDKSLIYDLFELSTDRSPFKTCHEIARSMNSTTKSPFYGRLKMLDKRDNQNQTLSQGTFVTVLCNELISKMPQEDLTNIKNGKDIAHDDKLVFRKYFIQNKDEVIVKILINYFSAARDVFPDEWENPKEYILSKTTGYSAMIIALKSLVLKGEASKNLSYNFFVDIFQKLKYMLVLEEVALTSKNFPSNAANQKKLADKIIEASNQCQ